MTKIFIESDELEESWYEELPLDYSYLWLILKLNCNKGGIVNLNKRRLSYLAKFKVDLDQLLEHFEGHITVIDNKFFINNFLADQNGYDLNLSNDAIRGRLKSYFEHEKLTEEILRTLGYRFFDGPKDNPFEIKNIKNYLFQYSKSNRSTDSIDKKFLVNKKKSANVEIDTSGEPMGAPIGQPRNSSSNSRSSSKGNSESNDIGEIRKNTPLTFENYEKNVINFKNVLSIEKQLTSDEFDKLLKMDIPGELTPVVFWNAVEDLDKRKNPVINNSVHDSLAEILIYPF